MGAFLWNLSEERGSEYPVDRVSSLNDFATSLPARVVVKSRDYDHNSQIGTSDFNQFRTIFGRTLRF